MKIESKTGTSPYPEESIYKFVSDFRNFNKFIPEEAVSDWEASEEQCMFKMDLLGKVELKIIEKEPFKLVKIVSNPDVSQYNFNLWIQIKSVGPRESKIKVTIEPLINAIMLGMVKSHLKKFVDSLVEEVEKFKFPDQ
jgi:hypothetical protein